MSGRLLLDPGRGTNGDPIGKIFVAPCWSDSDNPETHPCLCAVKSTAGYRRDTSLRSSSEIGAAFQRAVLSDWYVQRVHKTKHDVTNYGLTTPADEKSDLGNGLMNIFSRYHFNSEKSEN